MENAKSRKSTPQEISPPPAAKTVDRSPTVDPANTTILWWDQDATSLCAMQTRRSAMKTRRALLLPLLLTPSHSAHRIVASGPVARCASPVASELRQVWLDPTTDEEERRRTLGESIASGKVVMCVPDVVSDAEASSLVGAGLAARDVQRERTGRTAAHGRNRFWVPSTFDSEVVMQCEEILLRVLDRVDEELPSVYEELFRPSATWCASQPLTAQGNQPSVLPPAHLGDTCPTLRDLYMAGELEWSEGEPAINVYATSGASETGLTVPPAALHARRPSHISLSLSSLLVARLQATLARTRTTSRSPCSFH
jgi:hypothetical protein